jgi:hypothetical protein
MYSIFCKNRKYETLALKIVHYYLYLLFLVMTLSKSPKFKKSKRAGCAQVALKEELYETHSKVTGYVSCHNRLHIFPPDEVKQHEKRGRVRSKIAIILLIYM